MYSATKIKQWNGFCPINASSTPNQALNLTARGSVALIAGNSGGRQVSLNVTDYSNESPISPDYRYPQSVNPKPTSAPVQVPITYLHCTDVRVRPGYSRSMTKLSDRRKHMLSGLAETAYIPFTYIDFEGNSD